MSIKTLLIEYDEAHGNGMGEYALSAPAVEVVRCMDCKHGRSPQQGLPWMCIRNCCAHIPIDPDGFCAWGERRDA